MKNLFKILIVDDEFIIRQGIKHLLDWEAHGYEIIGEASNGKEALEIIEEVTPDIILTDIVMPVMDGIELTKEIRKKNNDIKIIILSGYSDFDYVKNTFQNGASDYLLKPTLNPKELLEILEKVLRNPSNILYNLNPSYNIENIISKYILGFSTTINTVEIEEQFNLPCFRLLGISKKACPNDLHIINSFFKNGVFEMLGVYHPYVLNVNDDIAVVLFNYSLTEDAPLIGTVKDAIDSLTTITSSLFFVLSDIFYNLEKINEIYNNGFEELARRKFYYKNISFLTADKFINKPKPIPFNIEKYNSLLNSLDFLEALALLNDFVKTSLIIYHTEEHIIKSFIQNSVYALITELETFELDTESLGDLKLTHLNEVESCEYADELLDKYMNISTELNEIIQNYQIKIDSDIMNKITAYMKEHYNEAINLNQISKKFNFSYYYLSSYFSAHSDEGFNEYLNKIRIDKAIEFLHDAKIPISQISTMVGYSDHSYFCKVFKKFVHTTPSKYRKGLN